MMKRIECPDCKSVDIFKNGRRKERQCFKCKSCGRQFLEAYRPWTYSEQVRQRCLNMYRNGQSLRFIERLTDVHHTTVLRWAREAGCHVEKTT
ncbi:MAG TPA: hypothetical protein V6C78_28395 [Crinalium sp.]